jgi:hypothetical protein
METKNIVIIGGIVLIAYLVFKKKKAKKPINIDPPLEQPKQEPSTIVINMNNKRKRPSSLFPNSMYAQYNASKMATVAPPMVEIF